MDGLRMPFTGLLDKGGGELAFGDGGGESNVDNGQKSGAGFNMPTVAHPSNADQDTTRTSNTKTTYTTQLSSHLVPLPVDTAEPLPARSFHSVQR